MQLGVGSDVVTDCGRCKQRTVHVIFAMEKGKIARVQCKVCLSYHNYKPDKEEAKEKEKGTALVRRRGEKEVEIRTGSQRSGPKLKPLTQVEGEEGATPAPKAAKAPRAPRAKAEPAAPDFGGMWKDALAGRDVSAAVPYTPSIIVEAGAVIDHSRFGLGVVQSLVDDHKKINVLFSDGIKLLVCRMTQR